MLSPATLKNQTSFDKKSTKTLYLQAKSGLQQKWFQWPAASACADTSEARSILYERQGLWKLCDGIHAIEGLSGISTELEKHIL
ncbi:hypothetical protein TUM3792_13780 [Shewanella sp. MBTL60-007]|nr:hypothetical protein TUM3792_13780 [Shewanella sp. MBTL60-007]